MRLPFDEITFAPNDSIDLTESEKETTNENLADKQMIKSNSLQSVEIEDDEVKQ